LTHTLSDSGIPKTIDLIPDGSNVAVTYENRLQFIDLMSQYRVNERIELQSKAFVDGLLEVIDSRWLRWVLKSL
jgi:ubiquitin-protein ligase E3 C